ncbi:hypothetical protein KRX19_05650 [Cardiobacteriaceae bacterium TAE3-ERU3]|nr:hypothetical protein [Cardiobacteriaceae bacterium TAE3-ERU3]
MSNYAIEHHLLRWRRWNQVDTGKPDEPVCLIGKMIKVPADPDSYDPLSDDEAEEVNTALQALKIRYPKAHEAILVRYQKGIFDDKYAARECGCSKAALQNRRMQGHSFLDGAIFAVTN